MATKDTFSTAEKRRSFYTGLFAFFILFRVAHVGSANHLQPISDLTDENNGEICESVDIRNTLETFNSLRGCHVVEGFVQILLFDNVNETELSSLSFPNLTEITDYLLLYRVNGLKSVGQLFPNLSVIRGQNTFFGCSLVIFEMSSLQEIGLYSLTNITHGLIRIDKNPSLCFVDTIDWDVIAQESGEHFIKYLKPKSECPICPGEDKAKEEDLTNAVQVLPASCPKAPSKFASNSNLCWNKYHCQKICPPTCSGACNSKGVCCNENCLGSCDDNDPSICTVCKNLSIDFGLKKRCMNSCPKEYYKFLGRRCIKQDECTAMKRPLHLQQKNGPDKPYKIFNDSCILECPPNYMSDDNTHTCKLCEGTCMKKCAGVNVDSTSSLEQLKGCTHITSSLEIQLRGGKNVVKDLEKYMGMIEEIDGYLKVVRSFPLISLNFLKNLKRIRGNQLESQKYVFVVLDNQNLQELWDWSTKKSLQIDHGRLFFHFNPKLCIKEIETLQRVSNLPNFTELEVASNSNGDKIACELEELKILKPHVDEYPSKGVILEWQSFKMDDQRKLLGYTIYYIEAPTRNVTLFDGRDACGGDGWRVDDVMIHEDEEKVTHPLTSLKPYTQYAFYVRTYTIATARKGAQSKIEYFTTLPSTPSPILNLQVNSNSSDSLKITWRPPISPSGKLTHYIVSGRKNQDVRSSTSEEMEQMCRMPSHRPKYSTPIPKVEIPVSKINNNDTCPCSERKNSMMTVNEDDIVASMTFENELHNAVYVKKAIVDSRKKRDTYSETFPNDTDSQKYKVQAHSIDNSTENGTDIWESFSFEVYGMTEYYITKLHHFTNYDIFVQACRERTNNTNDDKSNYCSNTSMQTQKTGKKAGADDIKQVQITNQSWELVSITWKEPEDPNGVLICYTIEYKRLDNENSKPNEEYLTHPKFLNQSRIHTLRNLSPGNYSLRVFATTYADNGAYSPYIYFFIEERTNNTNVIVIVCITTILVAAVGGFLFYRKQKADKDNMRLIPSVNPEYVPSVYVPDEWEVSRKKIELIRELNQGSFGMVYEGIARDVCGKSQIKCAVKTVNEHATNRERLEFLNEASVMKAFDTAHVVRLLGVVSQGQPTLVIMELMANGDLKSYLRSHRPNSECFEHTKGRQPSPIPRQPPTLKQILQMAIEIADGMAYLSAKKFVHRDLAARNCMVAENLTVKIGDFGMTRDIYETDYYRKGTKGLLPVRWMAPESLKDGVFTSTSDVWSYGVVLWEMATLGSQPYQGLSNDQVLRYVIDGGVMERPENCPDKLYTLMRYCWEHKPSARPSFLKLCSLLHDDASPSFVQLSFYHSPAGIEARSLRPTPSPSQDDPTTPLRIADDHDVNFSLNSDSDDEFNQGVTHNRFPSIGIENSDVITANGYVGGCPTDDAATTEC